MVTITIQNWTIQTFSVSVFLIVTVDNVVFVVVVVLQQNTISTIKHNHEKKKPTVNLASI